MKKFETFRHWTDAQSPKQIKMIKALGKLVKEVVPPLKESVNWGNGFWLREEWPVIFLHAKEDYLQFGFFGGTGLSDPKVLLQGTGKHVKHVKIFTMNDIDENTLAKFIREAVCHEKK